MLARASRGNRLHSWLTIALVAAAGAADVSPALAQEKVLRAVMHADVRTFDPFMAAFGPIAKKVIYVDSDGPLARQYTKLPYTKIRRPIWPLDAEAKPGLIF